MADDIDTEVLIPLVESRPVLWDRTIETYKNKVLTRKTWKDVCQALNPTFKDMDKEDKDNYVKEVLKRWANIRDSYMKSIKKIIVATRSGAGAPLPKKYVYSDQLQFLLKIIEERPTDDGLTDVYYSGNDQPEESETSFKKPCYRDRPATTRNKIDPVEEETPQASENPEVENRHISFFKGIVPSLRSFDEDDILKLQIGILELISNIRKQKGSRKRKRTSKQHFTRLTSARRDPLEIEIVDGGQRLSSECILSDEASMSSNDFYNDP